MSLPACAALCLWCGQQQTHRHDCLEQRAAAALRAKLGVGWLQAPCRQRGGAQPQVCRAAGSARHATACVRHQPSRRHPASSARTRPKAPSPIFPCRCSCSKGMSQRALSEEESAERRADGVSDVWRDGGKEGGGEAAGGSPGSCSCGEGGGAGQGVW